jgi:hypothetical protein
MSLYYGPSSYFLLLFRVGFGHEVLEYSGKPVA